MKAFLDFSDAFDFVREHGAPIICAVKGNKVKLYPSGRALCARNYPYHDFMGDGIHCDCNERTGETIATYTLRF